MVLQGRGARFTTLGVFLFLAFTLTATADSGVCERRASRGRLEAKVSDPNSRFSFDNEGGIGGGGVCWWHSRFQRAVWSLAEFHPELPKPTYAEAIKIIDSLAHVQKVVKIPGYFDFFSFSSDFRKEIQHELEQWQLRDGFLNQVWIRGISGRSNFPRNTRKLGRIMDDLYAYSLRSKIGNFVPWIMIQLKGIESHAALMPNMRKIPNGYILDIVESNEPNKTLQWTYHYGDTQMKTGNYDMVPYRGFHRDAEKMESILSAYCDKTKAKRTTRASFPVEPTPSILNFLP